MRNDHLKIYLLEHKKNINLRDRLMLKWLRRNNPSYVSDDVIKYELYKRKFVYDESDWESEQDEFGGFSDRPETSPEIIVTTEVGERIIYSRELKSESTEDFFEKTFVRWGVVIGSGYGLISFFVDAFGYIKNSFFD